MITMAEHRIWITIPGLPHEREAAWEPLITELEQRHPELGPVIGWTNSTDAQIVVSSDVPTKNDAARVGLEAVLGAIAATGLEDLYPSATEVELATDDQDLLAQV